MVMKLNVKAQMNQAAREFSRIAKRLPSLTRDAINKTATLAERSAISTVAQEINLPERYVRNRFDLSGRVKDRRTKIRRASVNHLAATLDVYTRGLPVSQIAGQQLRRPGGGVKAKGGRFYKGAFRPQGTRYARLVFKRRGEARTPLMVPKIGLRQRLTKQFDENVSGAAGQRAFEREYHARIRRALARYGVQT